MSATEILTQLSKLPDDKKKSVSDYIAFLIAQAKEKNKGIAKPRPFLEVERECLLFHQISMIH